MVYLLYDVLFTGEIQVEMDEHARPDATIEQMAKLPPVFKKQGTVSAGNASVNSSCCSINNLLNNTK